MRLGFGVMTGSFEPVGPRNGQVILQLWDSNLHKLGGATTMVKSRPVTMVPLHPQVDYPIFGYFWHFFAQCLESFRSQEEEEELAQIPAEARLLYLLLNDPGIVDGWRGNGSEEPVLEVVMDGDG